jgi:hypothetical protein
VDAVFTYCCDLTDHGLDKVQLFRELSQLTYGVNWLGPYALDSGSVYANGEQRPCVLWCVTETTFSPPRPPLLLSHSLFFLCFLITVGYTHKILSITPTSEYSEAS